jgi:hypothetical protein
MNPGHPQTKKARSYGKLFLEQIVAQMHKGVASCF